MSSYNWLENRKKRTVSRIRLWADNPRLDPEENHASITDYASDLILDNGEKDSFLKLVNSIAINGFIPAEPVVVWQNQQNKAYYVAEGNRRILAIKLLLEPEKSPKSLRSYIRKQSGLVEKASIEKIGVCIAPSFEDCEWYINQRHTTSSLLRKWSSHQHKRWIASLYDKYGRDIEKVMRKTGQTKSELNQTLRILKIRDWALQNEVYDELSADDQESVRSHRLPISILERWFDNQTLKQSWGIEFDGDEVNITSNKASLYKAYTKWIELVLHKDEDDVLIQINTRTITSNFDAIFEALPLVTFDTDGNANEGNNDNAVRPEGGSLPAGHEEGDSTDKPTAKPKAVPIYKGNPNRPNLIAPCYHLSTSNYKLNALFKELKVIPLSRYNHCIAASFRVFLDLAVCEYIEGINCKEEMQRMYTREFYDISLKQRLEYLKSNSLQGKKAVCNILTKLLNYSNEHSLDTLNKYVHGKTVAHTGQRFLNEFWEILLPLFDEILDISER